MRLVPTTSGRLYVASKDDMLVLCSKPKRQIFDVIWNLAEEMSFLHKAELPYAKQVLCAFIPDFSVPSTPSLRDLFDRGLRVVLDSLLNNGKVLVHCNGGHGRTGMALAIIKKKLDNVSNEIALMEAQHYCQGPETSEQIAFVSAS